MLKIWNNRARAALLAKNDQGVVAKKETFVSLRAKVTRADGTVEPDRLIAFAHRNPIIHFIGAPLAYFNGWFWNRYYTSSNRRST